MRLSKDDIIFRAFALGLSVLETFVPKDDIIFRVVALVLCAEEHFSYVFIKEYQLTTLTG